GPVLPLTASGSDRSGDLLGAGDHSTQTTSDPVAAKVLGRGGTLAAPAGRADDFSWPRPGSDAIARPEISREPAPDTSEKPSSAQLRALQKTKPTLTRMRRRNPQLIRAPARVAQIL